MVTGKMEDGQAEDDRQCIVVIQYPQLSTLRSTGRIVGALSTLEIGVEVITLSNEEPTPKNMNKAMLKYLNQG